MKIALAQMKMDTDIEKNFQKSLQLICEAAEKKAELIIVPTANTKSEPSDVFQWEIKVQAFQNSVNVAMCNRVGVEGNMEFSGESLVVGFDGETIEMAGDQEELMLAEVNLSGATLKRHQRPYTSLRRTDLYE